MNSDLAEKMSIIRGAYEHAYYISCATLIFIFCSIFYTPFFANSMQLTLQGYYGQSRVEGDLVSVLGVLDLHGDSLSSSQPGSSQL